MDNTAALHERQLALLERCINLALANAAAIEGPANNALRENDSASTLATAGAFAFFVDMVRSCLILLRAHRIPAVFALSRAPLLALADLHNLKNDPRYALDMDAKRLAEWTRFFDNAQKYANPLVEPMAKEFDLAKEAEQLRASGIETGDAGGHSRHDAERLHMAGFEHEHRAVYWLWSLYAHANLGAIWGAHVTQEPRFIFEPKDDLGELITAADGLTAMTIGGMYAAFEQFGIDCTPLASLRGELSAIRAELGLNDAQA